MEIPAEPLEVGGEHHRVGVVDLRSRRPLPTLSPGDGGVGAHDVVEVGAGLDLPAKKGLGIYSADGSGADPGRPLPRRARPDGARPPSGSLRLPVRAASPRLETSRSSLNRDHFDYAKRNSPT